jgi:hypothetical protein
VIRQITVSKAAQIHGNAGKVRLDTNRYIEFLPQWRGSILRSRLMAPFLAALVFASIAVIAAADAVSAEETSVILTPAALAEMKQAEAEIDRIEAQTLERLAAPPDNQVQQIELLGKLMLYDKNLSVNRNEATAVSRPVRKHLGPTGLRDRVAERCGAGL